MFRHFLKSGHALLSPDSWKIRLVLWVGAILVGLVASGFAIATEHVEDLFRHVLVFSEYTPFRVTPVGLIIVAWLTRKFFPGSQGSGIPQSIAALQLSEHAARSKLISLRIAVGKVFLTLLGLLNGASIGSAVPVTTKRKLS